MHLCVIGLANSWGYRSAIAGKTQGSKTIASVRREICEAASKIVAYNNGFDFCNVPSLETVDKCIRNFDHSASGMGNGMLDVVSTKPLGRSKGTHVEQGEKACPGYLHELYRSALKVVGAEASWKEIAKVMNLQNENERANQGLDRPKVKLSRETI